VFPGSSLVPVDVIRPFAALSSLRGKIPISALFLWGGLFCSGLWTIFPDFFTPDPATAAAFLFRCHRFFRLRPLCFHVPTFALLDLLLSVTWAPGRAPVSPVPLKLPSYSGLFLIAARFYVQEPPIPFFLRRFPFVFSPTRFQTGQSFPISGQSPGSRRPLLSLTRSLRLRVRP